MRAVLCKEWGGPERLTLGQVAPPVPGPGEVLISVAAAGVNYADLLMVAGKYQEKPCFPFSPGLEVAGTIEALGDDVVLGRLAGPLLARDVLAHGPLPL